MDYVLILWIFVPSLIGSLIVHIIFELCRWNQRLQARAAALGEVTITSLVDFQYGFCSSWDEYHRYVGKLNNGETIAFWVYRPWIKPHDDNKKYRLYQNVLDKIFGCYYVEDIEEVERAKREATECEERKRNKLANAKSI